MTAKAIKTESFTLTISPKYVPNWGKWEAFRELMQNVIDRQHEFEAAEIIFKYFPSQQRKVIGNKFSVLKRNTLIFGETTKADDENAIGQYGEGYKLALVVLTRMGIRVRIRTLGEIWAPSIKFSEQFQTDLLFIEVMKGLPNDDVLFELDGVTLEDFTTFGKKCLAVTPPIQVLHTSRGDILLDENLRGQVFIEGLYVCTINEKDYRLRYGYNMKARFLNLDRDRQKLESWSLLWELGIMYNDLDSTYANMIFNLQKEKWDDCKQYETHLRNKTNGLYQALCSMHHDEFFAKYGKQAIPVETEAEAQFIKEKYNDLIPIVIQKTTTYNYITDSSAYKTSSKTHIPKKDTPYSLTQKHIKSLLAGKEFKDARDKMLKDFLPLTREWRFR